MRGRSSHPHSCHRARAAAAALLLALGATACDRGGDEGEYSAVRDTASLVESSMGDVALTADGAIEGEVTSGTYRRWLQARQAMVRANVALPSTARLRAFGRGDVSRLVSQLERNSRARGAIEDAGMSVEAWVVTAVALERQLALATGPQRRAGEAPAPAPPVDPGFDATLTDTLLIPTQPVPVPEPEPPVPARTLPTDPRPVPVPVPVPTPTETVPARAPQPTRTPTPATPARPAPRDTLRLEPIPAPAPVRPETTPAPAEPNEPGESPSPAAPAEPAGR